MTLTVDMLDELVDELVETPAPQAACYGTDTPETWFPRTAAEYRTATAVCATCPLRDGCYTIGVTRGESGVWGGELLDEGKPIPPPRPPGRPRKNP